MLVFDIDTKKKIQGQLHERPPSHAKEGFALIRSNTLYMKKKDEMTILKFDAFAKQILNSVTLERRTSFWQWFYEAFYFFANVIAVNRTTNKVYVSDSKNNLLYEIDD